MVLLFNRIKQKGLTFTFLYISFYFFNLLKNVIIPKYFKLNTFGLFDFENKKLPYFGHFYNGAFTGERTIEIPICISLLKNERKNKSILEVGNVLSHYYLIKHDILDKYEKGKSIINQDIINFYPNKKYDLVVSISTLEHVGWDDDIKDPKKIIKALNNIKTNCLNKNGKLIFTVPIGYNFYLDKLLKNNKIKVDKMYYFKRISWSNKWKQTNWDEIKNMKYDSPFNNANAIIVGIIKK